MSDNHGRLQAMEKKLVLVVDDEIINREILGATLQEDYEVIYASDGREAMAQIKRHSDTLALVMLDLRMPVMSGMVVLKLLADSPELSRIPVIVMTSDQEAEVACLELGALDFITKPYPRRNIILARARRTIELSEDRQIIRSTERDTLTGLYNREYFYSYAETFDQHHKGTAMDAIVVDINHFHLINERYGRAYADQILRHIGDRLRESVRGSGGIVCRREADTFMAYCPHREDYREMLERASEGLAAGENAVSRVRLRMGVYPNVDRKLEMEQRFDRAKTAADAVRSNYKQNVSLYDDKLHESELFAEQLIEDFDKAIAEKQFKVYYQPKFDIRPEKPILASAEALIRWQHPTLGMISPGTFIPLFEANGMVQKLDNFVWAEAAAQVKAWKQRYGIVVPVSVNVSRVDMFDADLVATFERLLKENDLAPEELLLEITESAYTDDAEYIISTVNALRALGMKVEMDDFGTGYSSLGMISHLPIDALKLDMMFVRNAFDGQGDVRMLELIIDIADYLGVPVIAEGVETREQVNALKTMGCDIVQGFYFSKPIPPEAFGAFVEEKKRALETMAYDGPTHSDKGLMLSSALLGDFESLYYVDIDTGYYMEFGTQSWHDNLRLQKGGEDFFGNLKRDVASVIFPEDQEKVFSVLDREGLVEGLSRDGAVTLTYRLMIDGAPRLYRLKAAYGKNGDDRHVVIAVSNVDAELGQGISEEHERASALDFSSIAAVVSGQYDTIYYVDSVTEAFTVFKGANALEGLEIHGKGINFYDEFRRDLLKKAFTDDRDRVSAMLSKEAVTAALDGEGEFFLDCRLLVDGALYTCRMNGFYPQGEDRRHFLVGVRSTRIDAQWLEKDAARSNSVTYTRIAQALSQDFFTVYYVNARTKEYIEYSMEGENHRLYPVAGGSDFFTDCAAQVPDRVIASDRDRVTEAFGEQSLLKAIRENGSFSISYQVLLGGLPTHVNVKAMAIAEDPDHIVIGMRNIDAQVRQERAYEEAIQRSVTYARLAEALAADYFSIYYVDVETDRFSEFTAHDAYEDLGIEKEGEDFFNLSRKNIMRVCYPEDQSRFLAAFTKENVLKEIAENGSFTITYRLMIGGVPNYVSLKANAMKDSDGKRIVVGVNNIHAEMQRRMETVTYAGIAEALAADYFSIYYVDTNTDKFIEYSSHEEYEVLNIEKGGDDFFNLSRTNVLRVMHPDDQKEFLEVFTKENLMRSLDENGTFTISYRLVFDGAPTWVMMKATRMMDKSDPHIVIGVNNIDTQMQRQEEYERARRQSLTYSRIAQALSQDYYSIYLVNTENDEFVEYSSNAEFQELQVEQSGANFFEDCRRNVIRLVHPDDLKKALTIWEKENLLEELRDGKTFSVTYRLMFDGNPVYINCKVIRLSGDEVEQYIVIGISNVDAQIRREQVYAEDLKRAKNAALLDALTGVKSKLAFTNAEKDINTNIELNRQRPFAVAVCDVNGLKAINDTQGHKAGDEFIKQASTIVCNMFKHSPVYRVGGDEFVAILQGSDYREREALRSQFEENNRNNRDGGGIVIACGISEWDVIAEEPFEAVFERADAAMYENKKRLKRQM